MGQWISSKEFALQYNLVKKSLEKACFRAKQHGKKICMVKSNILYFDYTNGIGRGGKVLQIWSEPFNSEAEANEFITYYRINRLENAVRASRLEDSQVASVLGVLQSCGGDGVRDVSLSLNMTKGKMTSKGDLTKGNVSKGGVIESNIASIKKELDTTMGGVVDSDNGLCSDLHICDDEVGVIKDILHTCNSGLDVSLSLNMTNKGSITSEYSMTRGSVNDEIAMSALQSRNDNVDYVKDVLNSRNDKEAQDTQETNLQNTKQETQDIHSQKAGQDNLTSFDFATTKARRIALEKKRIIKDWESLKNKGVSAKDFVAVVNLNANNDYNLKLSENKLYAWQRAYKEQGLDGLLDVRGYAREGINTISH